MNSTTTNRTSFFLLATALALASLTACAGSSGQSSGSTATPAGTPAEGSSGTGPSNEPAGHTSKPAGPMKPLVATQHAAALATLGLDPNALPEMDKLTPEQVRKVMSLFTKSLGVDCKFCHKSGDFKAPTEHKKLAERMWNEWVHGMKLSDATSPTAAQTPVFCDSCHQGSAEFLDKGNHEELAKWMKNQFVDRLHPAGGAAVSCETCHGKPFDGDFLEKWEKL